MSPAEISAVTLRCQLALRSIQSGASNPVLIEQVLQHDVTALISQIRYLERALQASQQADHA